MDPLSRLPAHVAIIMDGNGRWAEQRGLPRTKGHEEGERALFDVVEGALEVGLRYLSVFAFSTENWTRPPDEVEFLLEFNRSLLRARREALKSRGVRLRRIGRRDGVPDEVLSEFDEAERVTNGNSRLDLLVCFNYGGRAELEDAAAGGRIAEHLYAPDAPDVDLLIRTSGERRLSNFLLWQSAYAELYFTETLWPDFKREGLLGALQDYASRERRFGGL
ncbi:MAG: trans,polycis-polyprenyl diphosphate synthase [Actinomycetota bacterium]|jgi:undecaprenyl diphosphate synthase|nr:trans,polycis-polyprenyl diphosphate synthase [Actinomycetota bacterium]